MADIKISAVPSVASATTGAYFPVVVGGVTSKVQAGSGGGIDADTLDGKQASVLAPLPIVYATNALGEWKHYTEATGTELLLPAGGKYAYMLVQRVDAGGALYTTPKGAVAAGGATVGAAVVGMTNTALVWKVE